MREILNDHENCWGRPEFAGLFAASAEMLPSPTARGEQELDGPAQGGDVEHGVNVKPARGGNEEHAVEVGKPHRDNEEHGPAQGGNTRPRGAISKLFERC